MPPDDSDDATPRFPVTQAELEAYRQLESVCRIYGRRLAAKRQSIIDRLADPLATEPGPLRCLTITADTRAHTIDEDGNRRPVQLRRLVIYEGDDETTACPA